MENINIISEMEYEDLEAITNECKVLAEGEYNQHKFKIISYGTHPCCYVRLNESDKLFGQGMHDIDIKCHGGITFSNVNASDERFAPYGHWIGWDYAHDGDAYGKFWQGHRYFTQELVDDVKSVINQIV